MKTIVAGTAEGPVVRSSEPINFLGGVDKETGVIRDRDHPLHGRSIAGSVLAFPHGAGSSVGAYTIYSLAANGAAPAAMVCTRADLTVATGCAVAGIPMLVADAGQMGRLQDGQRVRVGPGAIEPA